MQHPLDMPALTARLDELAGRISEAKAKYSAAEPEFHRDLETFVDRHETIRSMIDEMPPKSALPTAESATTELESGFTSWLKSIDKRYGRPAVRNNSVSM